MNIEDTLRERIPELSEDVRGGPSLQRALQKGRARRRRRAVAAVGSGVATVCAVGVVAGAALTGAGPFAGDAPQQQEAPQWALAVPPETVPYAIERAVRQELPDNAKITHTRLEAFGKNDKRLPKSRWDEATAWYGTFEFGPGKELVVDLVHSLSDAEGNDRKYCAQDDKAPFSSCEYSELPTGEHVMTGVQNGLRGSQGTWSYPVDPAKNKDSGRLWFQRNVEFQPGGAYIANISNNVKATSRKQADKRWTLGVDAMRRVIIRGGFLDDPSDS